MPLPADFHFLRPWWLLLLPLTSLLAWWCLRPSRAGGGWRAVIDPALLPALLLPGEGASSRWPRALLLLGWLLAVLGLAGPAWERLPEPVERRGDALVIAIDLSLSMYAGDLAPSRLERARFKLRDVLAGRLEGYTALIAYAGDAHIVTPLSDDRRTLESMLPALGPELMPVEGSDPVAAARLAGELLRGAGLERGRLLLVADTLTSAQARQIEPLLGRHGLALSVLAVGTREGAPVTLPGGGFVRDRNGSIVVPGLDIDGMRESTQLAGGRFSLLALDDADLRTLLPEDLSLEQASVGAERLFDQWQDRAPWLALALLPLAALALRRGWLLVLPLAVLLAPASPAQAFEWQDLWLTRDQQGARALERGDAARATELFRQPGWRGTAAYEAGDYGTAAQAFAGEETPEAHYNRGNALARGGQLEQALEAYDAALAAAPGMQDARDNRKLVEDLLRQQQQQQQQQQGQSAPQQGAQQPDDGGSASSSGTPPRDDSPRPGKEGAGGRADDNSGSADTPAQDRARAGDEPRPGEDPARTGDSRTAAADGERRDEPGEPGAAGEESAAEAAAASQALEQWLRQVPDRPGDLLRRKFEYEYRQRNSDQGAYP